MDLQKAIEILKDRIIMNNNYINENIKDTNIRKSVIQENEALMTVIEHIKSV